MELAEAAPSSSDEPPSHRAKPIEMPIVADVGLSLSAPAWQGLKTYEWKDRLLPFKVDGPPEALALLKKSAKGTDWGGRLSPPTKITIKGRRARLAGIPENAEFYAFAHPLACLEGQYESLAPSQPWEYFVLLGGYVYFDADRQLVACNALVHSSQPTCLHMIGPFQPSETALDALRQQGRLVATTLAPLREAGFERVGWVNPRETPGGGTLLAGGTDIQNDGCFVYELAGGSLAVLYEVVNLAVFGMNDEDALNSGEMAPGVGRLTGTATEANRRSSGGDRDATSTPMRPSELESMEFQTPKEWVNKAQLIRSQTFTYKCASPLHVHTLSHTQARGAYTHIHTCTYTQLQLRTRAHTHAQLHTHTLAA